MTLRPPATGSMLAPAELPAIAPQDAAARFDALGERLQSLSTDFHALREQVVGAEPATLSRLEIFHQYMAVFVVAFVVTLLATPLMRRLAVANGIVDRPSEARKIHRAPVAYLGGVAVFLGIFAAVVFSYLEAFLPVGMIEWHTSTPVAVPIPVLGAMTAIMLIGLFDDVVGISPRVKIGGQLLTASLLAFNDVGVKVAAGLLAPIGKQFLGNERMVWDIALPVAVPFLPDHIQVDVIYWTGTAIIAVFVLGACNASNLIDGLDGLLSGVTAIAMVGLLFVALTMAMLNDGPLDAARLILTLAILGACLGFLPHNFNPASIFLGDAGSMLLGFCTAVVILSLGDTGKTHLVVAGLIIYAVPIIDTCLAIVRRKMAGKSISAADDQHLHHQLKRSLGVKGAVLTLYGIAGAFALMGVGLSLGRGRVIYALALVLVAFIGVTAFKIARRERIEQEAREFDAKRAAMKAASAPTPPRPDPARQERPTPV